MTHLWPLEDSFQMPFISGSVRMDSIGSWEPIDFEKWVLEPIHFVTQNVKAQKYQNMTQFTVFLTYLFYP